MQDGETCVAKMGQSLQRDTQLMGVGVVIEARERQRPAQGPYSTLKAELVLETQASVFYLTGSCENNT